ncbi:MAG TPA: hypothetical protein PK961_00445 [bacterium]|nr:hypothetical protein [bacterium]
MKRKFDAGFAGIVACRSAGRITGSFVSDIRLLMEHAIGIQSNRSSCLLVPWYSHTNFFCSCPQEFTMDKSDYLKKGQKVNFPDFFANFFRSLHVRILTVKGRWSTVIPLFYQAKGEGACPKKHYCRCC